MFSAYRCKRGYEEAKRRAAEQTDETKKQFWLHKAQVWMSRWRNG